MNFNGCVVYGRGEAIIGDTSTGQRLENTHGNPRLQREGASL